MPAYESLSSTHVHRGKGAHVAPELVGLQLVDHEVAQGGRQHGAHDALRVPVPRAAGLCAAYAVGAIQVHPAPRPGGVVRLRLLCVLLLLLLLLLHMEGRQAWRAECWRLGGQRGWLCWLWYNSCMRAGCGLGWALELRGWWCRASLPLMLASGGGLWCGQGLAQLLRYAQLRQLHPPVMQSQWLLAPALGTVLTARLQLCSYSDTS